MSRRQHFLNEDIPYVGNLVFYAPLTNGRNTDLVGSIVTATTRRIKGYEQKKTKNALK